MKTHPSSASLAVALSLSLSLTLSLCLAAGSAAADQLKTHFSCSDTRDKDGSRVIFADVGTIELDGTTVKQFQWESALHRETHGNECSIDESDGPQAEVIENGWSVTLKDSAAARQSRGYDTERSRVCAIRVLRHGNQVILKPSCSSQCGSRSNFSALTINIKTGACQYNE
jgi:hypothetical protein